MKKIVVAMVSHITMVSSLAMAAPAPKIDFPNNSNVPPQNIQAPTVKSLGFYSDDEIMKMASDNFKAESKRRPSGGAMVGTEDMISKEYAEFRDKLIKSRTGGQFYDVIKEYDAKYDQIPAHANDLKFAVARLAAWLPMRGVVWRMTPLVHKVVVTQQVLLTSLRNIAEQVKINEPDSHVEAQMLYLTMPDPELLGKQFNVESDFITFLANEVYPSLKKSVARLEAVKMVNVQEGGKETPIVFDGRIRFGENAFNSNYDAFERFKIVGEAERFAALARINRRMFAIASMTAYNWNGHMALRREIGKLFGVGAMESALFDILPGEDNVYLAGATRDQRVAIMKKYKTLYTLAPNGKQWMKLAYYHLHRSGLFLEQTWSSIKNEDPNYVMQLDPEIFTARKEQVEIGVANMKKMVGQIGDGVSGRTTIRGSLSGEELTVDVKGYYDNPPADLKNLLPTSFAKNEDLDGLKKLPSFKGMSEVRSGKDVMQVQFANGKTAKFRNYLYGRAKTWNIGQDAYGRLFPGLKDGADVAKAMRILNETRGARVVGTGVSTFVR